MIEFIFTLDYELYGDGTGSLRELILEPADLLAKTFEKWNSHFVIFVEAAELEILSKRRTDQDIDSVLTQINRLYSEGHEIGLHLHPQWYNAKYEDGRWQVDISEYNLCKLPPERIRDIVSRSVEFLRNVLGKPDFNPICFRAGNWLFQPTQPAASVLFDHGIRIDSSVFRGGYFREYGVDYRKARKNGYFWKFWEDAVVENLSGALVEIPIYTKMVPPWEMITGKRLEIQKRAKVSIGKKKSSLSRVQSLLRFKYPKKLDFCRMDKSELNKILREIIGQDEKSPSVLKPIVAIGHTKDLRGIDSVDDLLNLLHQNRINISTFNSIYNKLK